MKRILLTIAISLLAYSLHAQIYFKTDNIISQKVAQDIQSIYNNLSLESSTTPIKAEHIQGGVITLVQFDVLQKASYEDMMNGTDYAKNIKVLLPMGEQEIHLVAKKNSSKKIDSFQKIKEEGVKVAVVREGLGTETTADVIKQLAGGRWTTVYANDLSDATRKLLENKIDAFFFVGYTPTEGMNFFNTLPFPIQKNIVLLPLNDPELVGSYTPTTIKANTYKWAGYDVDTYAVKTYLATSTSYESAAMQEDVLAMLKAIKNNLSKLTSSQDAQTHIWKRVKFDYSNVNWSLHDIVKKVGSN